MQKKIRKIVSSILASCMVISAFAGIAPQKAEAKTTLVNVAVDGKASTESGQNGEHVIGNINDGDPKTSWQTPGTWPATAVIQLDKGRSISKVAVELGEDGDNSTGRTALVTVKYAQNGITTDLVEFGTKSDGRFKRRVYRRRSEVGNAYLCNAFRSEKSGWKSGHVLAVGSGSGSV